MNGTIPTEENPLALSAAYATWVKDTHNNQWIVFGKNKNELGRFPAHWKERDCMTAIRLGRKYEVEAFNRGTALGKQTTKKAYIPLLEQANTAIEGLKQMNIKLSEKLEKFIIGESDEVN